MADDWNDDPLLRDLAAFAREEEEREEALLDGRWDALARGELEAEEARRLLEGDGGGKEARERQEAFRPLEPAFHERVAARLVAELAAPAGARRVPVTPAAPVRREHLTGALAVRRRASRRSAWRALAAAAVLAAAALFVPRLWVPPFPAYEVAVAPLGEVGERAFEAAPRGGAPALFHPGTAFEAAVRPLAPVAPGDALRGNFEVRCYLQGTGAAPEVRAWVSCAERAEIAPTLAVRVAGTVGEELTLEPGSWTLWIVLGRRGEIADLERRPALLAGEAVARRDWIALRVPTPLRMEPAP